MGDSGETGKIQQIFQTMEYGEDEENTSEATNWLKTKGNRLFSYIDKKDEMPHGQVLSLKNINNDEILCNIHIPDDNTIDAILTKAADTKNKWAEEIPSYKRAEIIYKLGAEIFKKQEILAQIEVVARGILSKDTKSKAISLLTDYLQYYSSFSIEASIDGSSRGLCAGLFSDKTPLALLGCVLGPSLASGQCIILQTGPLLSLAAAFIIDIAHEVGVPEGTIRLIPGYVDPNVIFKHPKVTTVAIFDDISKEEYTETTSFKSKKILHFSTLANCPMLVFDNADLDSACQNVMQAAWGYKGMTPWSLRNIFVQENVFKIFIKKLKHRINQLKINNANMKNVDITYPYGETLDKINKVVEKTKNIGIEIYQKQTDDDNFKPTLFIGGNIIDNNVIKNDHLDVPIVTISAFRSINEAVALANNSKYGLAASVWSENTSLVHEISRKLRTGNIWINSYGLFAANIPISPYKNSGNAYFGGFEGYIDLIDLPKTSNYEYTKATAHTVNDTETFETVVNVAKKAQANWFQITRLTRMKILQSIAHYIATNKNNLLLPEEWLNEWIKIIHGSVVKHPSQELICCKEYNVLTLREPCGLIAVEMPENMQIHNKKLIISALLEGNCVIILSSAGETTAFYSVLSKLFPNGILSVLPLSKNVTKVAALHKELNVYIFETINSELLHLPLKSSSKFKFVSNDSNWDQVRSKVSLVKNVWFNVGQSFN